MSERRDAAVVHDPVFDAYGEWVNNALFAAELGEDESLIWLGDGRWVLLAPEGPDVWLIELKRARIEVAP